MEALHDVVKAGKARYIGASSMYAWQFSKAQYIAERHGWTKFVTHAEPLQPPLSRGGAGDDAALRRPGHRRHPVEPARPRASSPATGTRRPSGRRPTSSAGRSTRRRPTVEIVERVAEIAAERAACRGPRSRWRGCSRKPVVTAPIVGATKPHHLDDAVAAVDARA